MDFYTNNRIRVSKRLLDIEAEHLSDLVNRNHPFTKSQVISAFCNDLKSLLGIDDIYILIQEIFNVESKLTVLNEIESGLPSLADFYQNLSPILLRALMESDHVGGDSETVRRWKEALRIAIEEELYFWKEKLLD